MERAAIVIGVNRTTGLPELTGAASDADAFAKWIEAQGFSAMTFTDDGGGKVRFSDIFDDVLRIVRAGTCKKLVIYFSGHGFQAYGSEIWLLTGAPQNAAEAIALEPSVMAARESGIASVVFISDACRSIPDTLEFSRVAGASIFPNRPVARTTRPKVDRFFATLPSLVAVASAGANDAGRRGGIFTRQLIDAHTDTPAEYALKVDQDGLPIEVVTNRALGDLVREKVEEAVYAEAPQAGQLPDAIIESVNEYMGRVDRTPEIRNLSGTLAGIGDWIADAAKAGGILDTLGGNDRAPAHPAGPPPIERMPSVAAIAQEAIAAAERPPGAPMAPVSTVSQRVDDEVGMSRTIDRYTARAPVEQFESQTGFSVTGTTIVEAVSHGYDPEGPPGDIVRLWQRGGGPGASVLMRFADGGCTLLPTLFGYIGHIFVENGAITNVNYVPARNHQRWDWYEQSKGRLQALRAAVAAAAGLGVFRIAPEDAEGFADRIRYLKALDPTLGLYAAYAYAGVGLDEKVHSVRDYMRDDLACDLFDVAMLSERGVDLTHAPRSPIYPACPMLRQGWSLLPVREARLAPVLYEAQQWLRPALWTTFGPEAMAPLAAAIRGGDLR